MNAAWCESAALTSQPGIKNPPPQTPFSICPSVCSVTAAAEGGLDFCRLRSLPNYLALSLNGRLPSIIPRHMATTGDKLQVLQTIRL